ncbi:MAG: alpha/beta hydrolase [Candidatus Hodarchaeales archaeon]
MIGEDRMEETDKWSSYIFHPRPHHGIIINDTIDFDRVTSISEGIKIVSRCHIINCEKPLIILFHGNGETAVDYEGLGFVNAFKRQGINTIVTDYRGYGDSTGKPSMRAIIEDAKEIFDKLISSLGIKGPIFVMGRSLGSAPAIELAVKRADKIKGLIIESGFAHTYELFRRLGVPQRMLDPRAEKHFSNIRKIKMVDVPLLVIHGENDCIIPVRDGKDLYRDVLTKRKKIIIIKGAGHNDIWYRGQKEYLSAVIEFIRDGSHSTSS